MRNRSCLPVCLICALTCASIGAMAAQDTLPRVAEFADSSGKIRTLNTHPDGGKNNPFFQSLGTNGRTCSSCHLPRDAMGLSAATARRIFASTHGQDPLFADVDGADCEGLARDDALAHRMILGYGLLRIALPVPDNADYSVQTVSDPYGCADYIDPDTDQRMLSEYRRPLPATNLRFLSAVMIDGRETIAPLNDANTFNANLITDLKHQALDATLGHAQAAVAPTDEQLSAIVDFELGLYSAQATDAAAGNLHAKHASGGPRSLVDQRYYPGINDPLGADSKGFTSSAFSLFSAWNDVNGASHTADARQQIAAGEQLFNTFTFTIKNVTGLNDVLNKPQMSGTCTLCHDAPNVGNHSVSLPLDIGVSHAPAYETDPNIQAALATLQLADLPIYKVTCPATTPIKVVYASDLGKALVSGHCSDLLEFKGPILRGLAARAPYFHNGAAATLKDVVEFYNQRFAIGFSEEQEQQLVAFLKSL